MVFTFFLFKFLENFLCLFETDFSGTEVEVKIDYVERDAFDVNLDLHESFFAKGFIAERVYFAFCDWVFAEKCIPVGEGFSSGSCIVYSVCSVGVFGYFLKFA